MNQGGKIYYCSDQFGVKFIMLKESTLPDWVMFSQSAKLKDLLTKKKFDSSQFKTSHFIRLLNSNTFNSYFKGCIEVPSDIIDGIRNNQLSDVSNYPYLQIINGDIYCKVISKEDFRNMKLLKILNDSNS